jgi:hypothetical protein
MNTYIKVERKVRSLLQDYMSVWELSVGEFQVDTVEVYLIWNLCVKVGPIFALLSVV